MFIYGELAIIFDWKFVFGGFWGWSIGLNKKVKTDFWYNQKCGISVNILGG